MDVDTDQRLKMLADSQVYLMEKLLSTNDAVYQLMGKAKNTDQNIIDTISMLSYLTLEVNKLTYLFYGENAQLKRALDILRKSKSLYRTTVKTKRFRKARVSRK